MIQKFHWIDRHKKFSTISVLNREGQEIQFLAACYDLRKYIEDLDPEDSVILEIDRETQDPENPVFPAGY